MNIKRKKRPLNRKIKHYRDTKLFIITTESKETEKQYFQIFHNPRIQVHVINTGNNRSAPKFVLNRLDRFYQEYDLGSDDELWLMVDVDRWGDRALSQITQVASQKGYYLAISNPCFEVWLYLHFCHIRSMPVARRDIIHLLRVQLGSYNKAHLQLAAYKPHIPDAIQRATELDKNMDNRWPQSTGTHVYKIVTKLIS